jgi:hypothetical protein
MTSKVQPYDNLSNENEKYSEKLLDKEKRFSNQESQIIPIENNTTKHEGENMELIWRNIKITSRKKKVFSSVVKEEKVFTPYN